LIQADPTSTEKFAWGHPYRRWSSFLATSTQEELLKSRAKIFMAAGTEDASVPINSFDTGVAKLRSRGREVEAVRLEGADHGFRKPTDKSPIEGFEMVFSRIADWYFQSSAKAGNTLV
jgi:dipeptidyl aminopeptidase/acylaminoacyl peptidase